MNAITGDCGYMMWLQDLARRHTDVPVFMSSLAALPLLETTLAAGSSPLALGQKFLHQDGATLAICTANEATFLPLLPLICRTCNISLEDFETTCLEEDVDVLKNIATHPRPSTGKTPRFQIIGMQDVPGFDAVEKMQRVSVRRVARGVVDLMLQKISENPRIKCILFECTQLGAFADALRLATGLPVFDAVNTASLLMLGYDSNNFGILGTWKRESDFLYGAERVKYELGSELPPEKRAKLLSLQINQKREGSTTFVRQLGSDSGTDEAGFIAGYDSSPTGARIHSNNPRLSLLRMDGTDGPSQLGAAEIPTDFEGDRLERWLDDFFHEELDEDVDDFETFYWKQQQGAQAAVTLPLMRADGTGSKRGLGDDLFGESGGAFLVDETTPVREINHLESSGLKKKDLNLWGDQDDSSDSSYKR